MGKAEHAPRSLPKLTPSYGRILESILFLVQEAQRHGTYVTERDIERAIFLADVDHLDRYGRPVTFDNYVATEDGPAPGATRDVLRPDFDPGKIYNEPWPLWHRVPSPEDGTDACRLVKPARDANLHMLSRSDVAALSDALPAVKGASSRATLKRIRQHPAYLAAWRGRGRRRTCDIDYTLLLEARDPELAHDIVYLSQHQSKGLHEAPGTPTP